MARGFDEYLSHTAGHWGEHFDAPLDDNGQMVRTKGYIVDVCTNRAMVENQDMNVGRVLEKLDALDLADNTIVVYLSENGANSWRRNGGMKGRKGSTDEGGIRSVCYLRWPAGLAAGTRTDKILGAIDLLPTLTSLAGVEHVGNKPIDGRDLTPLMRGPADQWPDRKLFSTWAGKVTVRNQRDRLDHQGKLFDMIVDPNQETAVTSQQPEIAARLSAAVAAWSDEVLGEPTDTKKPKQRNAVDPRPIPMGYREFPITMLPARDGTPEGGVERSSRAPNCCYFVNWTTTDGKMTWLLDVHTTGQYKVTIDYTCPRPGNTGMGSAPIHRSGHSAATSGRITDQRFSHALSRHPEARRGRNRFNAPSLKDPR